MGFTVYGDNLIEIDWFISLSDELIGSSECRINGRGRNIPIVNSLIEYDRPDIILLRDDNPILVVEKTQEVPTGHNVGQRYARLVRAAEFGVPSIYFFPFDAMKHGTHANVCNLNIRLLKAMLNMGKIHEVPCLAVNWPSDDYGELIRDGTENLTISKLVDAIARGDGQHVDFISAQQRYMSNEYGSRLVRRAGYSLPPPSVYEIGTTDLLSRIGVNSSDPTYRKIMARESSIVYDIGMRPESCRRQDPYTGAQFVYDYLYCRNGPNPADKHTNLILHLPQLTRELWYRCNPNDSNSKSCNWYLTADALWFENGIDLLR